MDNDFENPLFAITKQDLLTLTLCLEVQIGQNKQMLEILNQILKQSDLSNYKDRQTEARASEACQS